MARIKMLKVGSVVAVLLGSLLLGTMSSQAYAKGEFDAKNCTFNGIPLKGKVKVVSSFADIKVQKTSAFPDLKVKFVQNFADVCGEWQMVNFGEDFTIEYVSSFPDITIEQVSDFPGVRQKVGRLNILLKAALLLEFLKDKKLKPSQAHVLAGLY